ncbi:hypothetical protein N0V94_007567 [Neodidymelliopsis sp. IMI 364377]|nr:hypothetical protein N0V94_007567 [Neodidymelliopsis sp. IMI 364377]
MIPDSATAHFSFKIEVTNLGTEDATFKGIFTSDYSENEKQQKEEVSWVGWFSSFADLTLEHKEIDLERPADADGSLQELKDIFPWSAVNTSTTDARKDAAQKQGDDLMILLMKHALNEDTRRKFLPNLQVLDDEARTILENNRDWFRRAGVHMFAEQLKKAEKIKDQDWSKHIVSKYETFNKMMSSTTAPKDEEDPVVKYGWDRKDANQMTLLNTLQKQYKEITMQTYLLGWKRTKPAWLRFVKTPSLATYWFKMFSAFLISDHYITRWKSLIASRDIQKGELSSTEEVLMWGNKLAMLKHHAPKEDQDKLNVDEVTEYMLGVAYVHLHYSQVCDDELQKHINESQDKLKSDETAKKIRKTFESRTQFDKDFAAALHGDIISIVQELADPNSPINKHLTEWYEQRLPPGRRPSKFTIEQVVRAIQHDKFVKKLQDSGWIDKPRIWQRIKAKFSQGKWINAIKFGLQSIIHGIAILGASISLLTNAKNMPVWELVVALVGLVGCVFGIVAAYYDIEKAKAIGDRDGRKLFIYSVIQMTLSILEGLLVVGSILAEAFAITAGPFAWCGPGAFVVGLVAIGVVVVYMIFFAPDPYEGVKKFLDDEGKIMGAYDESKEEVGGG